MFRSLLKSTCRNGISKTNLLQNQMRHYAPIIKVPEMGDSITEGTILKVFAQKGDVLPADAIVYQIETDKISADVRMPEKGKIKDLLCQVSDDVEVGQDLFEYDETDEEPTQQANSEQEKPMAGAASESKPEKTAPMEKKQETPAAAPQQQAQKAPQQQAAAPAAAAMRASASGEGEQRVKMSRMRKSIAARLKDSQNTYALLTTFNEIDMSKVMELRQKHKDYVQEQFGVKLGFMGLFCKAAAVALKNNPEVNAVIDGDDIVYRDYVDISIAVATPNGLVTPVVRNCESLSVVEIEQEIARLAKKAREGKIEMADMQGGTFTISNGGVYGSMMGTPIVNPPQSAIMGMHATKKRPVVVNENGEDKIVIRPVMFSALTYDHRLVDGKSAVTTLKMIGELIENPELLGLQ